MNSPSGDPGDPLHPPEHSSPSPQLLGICCGSKSPNKPFIFFLPCLPVSALLSGPRDASFCCLSPSTSQHQPSGAFVLLIVLTTHMFCNHSYQGAAEPGSPIKCCKMGKPFPQLMTIQTYSIYLHSPPKKPKNPTFFLSPGVPLILTLPECCPPLSLSSTSFPAVSS